LGGGEEREMVEGGLGWVFYRRKTQHMHAHAGGALPFISRTNLFQILINKESDEWENENDNEIRIFNFYSSFNYFILFPP